jgi:hypothetical protein
MTENDSGKKSCEGNVFYTRKSDGTADLTFETAITDFPYEVVAMTQAKNFTYECTNDFIGVDPTPGEEKACWCDSYNNQWVN